MEDLKRMEQRMEQMNQLFAQERKRNAEDKAGMQNDIDGLRSEQIIKDFKRMAILRVNCLHDIYIILDVSHPNFT